MPRSNPCRPLHFYRPFLRLTKSSPFVLGVLITHVVSHVRISRLRPPLSRTTHVTLVNPQPSPSIVTPSKGSPPRLIQIYNFYKWYWCTLLYNSLFVFVHMNEVVLSESRHKGFDKIPCDQEITGIVTFQSRMHGTGERLSRVTGNRVSCKPLPVSLFVTK